MAESGKILSAGAILAALPVRPAFLMLDRAELTADGLARGLKNLCADEPFFVGHFPGHPIVPGVLQVESMRQLGELLVRPQLDPEGTKDVYLRKLEKTKFRAPNGPGDRMKVEITGVAFQDGEAVLTATTANAQGLTCEAFLTLAVRERRNPDTMPALFGEYDRKPGIAMDFHEVMAALPHRFPFLLMDTVIRHDGDFAVAVKNLTINEHNFNADRNGYNVFPEALLCEAVAQAGCANVLSLPECKGKLGYFAAILSAESFAPVYPGDQLVMEVELPPPKKMFGKGTGIVRVEGREVFRITLMFALVDAN